MILIFDIGCCKKCGIMLILVRVVDGKIVKNTTFVPEAEKSPAAFVHTLVACYLLLCILTEDNGH